MLEYGLRWREFGKRSSAGLLTREKYFKTPEARGLYAERLIDRDGFVEFLEWTDPKATVH